MKIVLIGPVYPFRGGIAHFTSRLAVALRDAGKEVNIFSFRRQYPKWLYPGESDRDPSQRPFAVDARFLLDPMYPWTWRNTFSQIVQAAPDLVLFQWWTTFWSFAYTSIACALNAKGIRTGFLIHNVIPHEPKPWDRIMAKMTLGQGKFYLVQSDSQREALQQLIPDANIELAEHPVYDMFSAQKTDKESARIKLGIPTGIPLMLFFGIVRPYKGLSVLIDALGQLDTEGFQAGLYIAGEFWEDVQKYYDRIDHLKITDKVWIDNRYIPNEDLPIIFSAADVFIAPYIDGTQSGAAKMALGFGLPVVVTSPVLDNGMQMRLSQGVFTCLPGDPITLKTAIKQAIQYGRLDITPGNEHNSWQAMIKSIERLVLSY